MRQRRVWSELLPLKKLGEREVLDLLVRFDLQLLAAVRPTDMSDVRDLVRRCRDAGVSIGLWPMLDDSHGRWPSAVNISQFRTWVLALMKHLEGDLPDEIAMDLEPPFGLVSRIFSQQKTSPNSMARSSMADTRRDLVALHNDLCAYGVACSAAVVPMVLFDRREEGGWQQIFGTPIDGIPWSHVSVMAYTSILEGWSRGVLSRASVKALLAALATTTVARYGHAAGISLGAVHVGALGDEPIYRSPDELHEDVSIATAAGVETLTLFDLSGVLRRGPAKDWLEAFTDPPSRVTVASSLRATGFTALCRVVGAFPSLG
jgi:hypothetical protein